MAQLQKGKDSAISYGYIQIYLGGLSPVQFACLTEKEIVLG